MKKAVLSILLLGMLVASCSLDMDATDYDQSCTKADDCVAVLVGDVCGCGCELGAISKFEQSKYEQDRFERVRNCEIQAKCVPCPQPGPVVCVDLKCAMAP